MSISNKLNFPYALAVLFFLWWLFALKSQDPNIDLSNQIQMLVFQFVFPVGVLTTLMFVGNWRRPDDKFRKAIRTLLWALTSLVVITGLAYVLFFYSFSL